MRPRCLSWVTIFVIGSYINASQGLSQKVPLSSQRIHEISANTINNIDNNYNYKRHVVAKRDANEASAMNQDTPNLVPNLTSAFHLHNSHLHLMVHWVGQGSSKVFCLGKDQEMKVGATSQVFLSQDYGTTFLDISERFKLDDERNATIDRFYHHSKSNCHYVFTDTINRYIFTSTDCGETITGHKLELTPELVEYDPNHDKIFLVHDLKDPVMKLYVTKNFGQTFSHVQDYVKSFYFLKGDPSASDLSTLVIQRFKPPIGDTSTILSSVNFFERQVDVNVLYNDAKEFEMRNNYMFVTKSNPSKHPDHLDLFISANGERFVKADFGSEEANLDYHIIDVTDEGQFVICVNHNKTHSNLYTSTKITPYEVDFSLSLERVMYYNPKVTWKNTWLSDTAGDTPFADVYKIQGLRGIYIASQIKKSNIEDIPIKPDHLVSLITFDQGGRWSKISAPETDDEGFEYEDCKKKPCALHVTQQLSKKFPSTRSIPVMSSKNAVGLVMATGNIGQGLTEKSNVFLSADAGLSWRQVLKDSYYFNIGDHGGVLVAVKYFKTQGATNKILYSTDEGITWKNVTFYHEPLRVFGLLTEPGETTTTFTMFGTTGKGNGINWIIVKVDLRSVFDHECTDDDYKRWSPADGSQGKQRNCILGRKEVYQKREVHSSCYNGKDYERIINVENCECSRSDYLCDFGFELDQTWTDNCIKDPRFTHDPYLPPGTCKPGDFFNRTRGYVKIRGDSCSGGLAKRFEAEAAPCPVAEEAEFLLVSQRQSIVRINLRDTNDSQTLPLKNVDNVITLEFDVEDNCVMYGDIELDKIYIQCLNSSEPRVLVESNLQSVEGMAYDWITKTLYFVDGLKRTIELVRVDLTNQGRMRKTLMQGKYLTKPRGIAVHPLHGYLFYTDWNEKMPHIGRANLDGTGQTILQKNPLVQWPNGLSIDYIANRIYWVDAQKDFIASCDFDGKEFKKVLSGVKQLIHPFSVAVFKELMYWDDWNKKSIYMADKNSGKGITLVQSNMNGAMDMKIFSSIHRNGKNKCSEKPCSHLCVAMPDDKFECLCPDGMKAEMDATSKIQVCKCPDGQVPNESGTCPQNNGVCESTQFTCANNLCIPEKWKCDGNDDCGDKSDEADCIQDECHELQFQCANKKCIPDYWKCDFDNDCGDFSDERNCSHKICEDNQFHCNNGQCVDKKWVCDMEKDCSDGSDEIGCVKRVTNCKTDEFQCPNAGQCLPNSWLCDGDSDCPDGADESNCENESCKDWQFRCDDGSCIFQSWHCDNATDCTDGSDERNCTYEAAETFSPTPVFPQGKCNEWMFKCGNEQCIPFWWRCDGATDCSDESDEFECDKETVSNNDNNEEVTQNPTTGGGCPANKYECSDGTCIWQAWVCDGDNDCPNGEDESHGLCSNRQICEQTQFRCEQSAECVDYSKTCDNHIDCADGSDEHGCKDDAIPIDTHCPVGYFSCDEGQCFSNDKICDGKHECNDGSDELTCSYSYIEVHGLSTDFINSTAIRVKWWIDDISQTSDLLFQPSYAVEGTDLWRDLQWMHINTFSYMFEDLFPYTTYKLRMNVKYNNITYAGKKTVTARTATAKPSAPTINSVTQLGGIVNVSWTRPSRPNGELKSYTLFMEPGAQEWQTSETHIEIEYPFRDQNNYTFHVFAVNEIYKGESSKPSYLVFNSDFKDEGVNNLEVLQINEDSVLFKFDKPKANSHVKKYSVNIKCNSNPFAVYDDLIVDRDSTDKVLVPDLSPNETYFFNVAALLENGRTGPRSSLKLTTTGKSLPKPIITEAHTLVDKGTSIRLNWKLAGDEKRKKNWVYGVRFGITPQDLISRNAITQDLAVTDTSYTVDKLESCEKYSFVVLIVGPKGQFGPPSDPFVKSSKYSPGAPPKDVRARIDANRRMTITWKASCPEVTDEIAYLVQIKDLVKGTTENKQTDKSNRTAFSLDINNVHHGTTYEITINTDAPDSTASKPVRIDSPEIPKPQGLTHHIMTDQKGQPQQMLFWNPANSLPDYISEEKMSYQVLISENYNMSDPIKTIEVSKPPYEIRSEELRPGQLYYVSVVVSDGEGYVSSKTTPVAFENTVPSSDIVIPRSRVAGILLPIFVLLCVMGAGLGYYVYRNRRLTRSFQALYSRYREGGDNARILEDHNLDDEDLSPIIRGFADDEPLVIT